MLLEKGHQRPARRKCGWKTGDLKGFAPGEVGEHPQEVKAGRQGVGGSGEPRDPQKARSVLTLSPVAGPLALTSQDPFPFQRCLSTFPSAHDLNGVKREQLKPKRTSR